VDAAIAKSAPRLAAAWVHMKEYEPMDVAMMERAGILCNGEQIMNSE
jgi:hypothetical protein